MKYIYFQSIVHSSILYLLLSVLSFLFFYSFSLFLLKEIANLIPIVISILARLIIAHHSLCIFSWMFYSIDFPASFPRFSRHRCRPNPLFTTPATIATHNYPPDVSSRLVRNAQIRRTKNRAEMCFQRGRWHRVRSVHWERERERDWPRTILEPGSLRRTAPRPSFYIPRTSRLDLGPSHAPPTPRGSPSTHPAWIRRNSAQTFGRKSLKLHYACMLFELILIKNFIIYRDTSEYLPRLFFIEKIEFKISLKSMLNFTGRWRCII